MESYRIDDDDDMRSAEWEREYFKKFEWLSNQPVFTKEMILPSVFEYLRNHMRSNIKDPEPNYLQLQYTYLYLYYVELENNKMILHADVKKPVDQILQECSEKYEFARLHKPIRVVYIMNDIDVYDIDKNVKLFMHMFGLDETRGGSYIEPVLPDYVVKTLEREFAILNIQDYIHT
jgi:hypothetical protein